jgi:hypothetical protein
MLEIRKGTDGHGPNSTANYRSFYTNNNAAVPLRHAKPKSQQPRIPPRR